MCPRTSCAISRTSSAATLKPRRRHAPALTGFGEPRSGGRLVAKLKACVGRSGAVLHGVAREERRRGGAQALTGNALSKSSMCASRAEVLFIGEPC